MRLNMTSRILESVQESNDDTKSLSYKALKEEATIKEGLRNCPRCGNSIIGYPAVSRYDNTTEICSDCGTDEALENMAGYMTNPNTGERISLEDLKAQRRAENEDRAGELRAAMDDGALADDEIEAVNSEISELEDNLNEDESISEDTLKESVDWTSNPIWTKVINTLDSAIYDMEKEEAIALLEQIKKDCDVFISSLK